MRAPSVLALSSFGVCCLFSLGRVAAQPVVVPDSLEPWRNWVLYGEEFRACPVLNGSAAEQAGGPVCAWPGRLSVEVAATRATFDQSWTLYADGWIPLPGDADHWPTRVTSDGNPAAVTTRDARGLARGARTVWPARRAADVARGAATNRHRRAASTAEVAVGLDGGTRLARSAPRRGSGGRPARRRRVSASRRHVADGPRYRDRARRRRAEPRGRARGCGARRLRRQAARRGDPRAAHARRQAPRPGASGHLDRDPEGARRGAARADRARGRRRAVADRRDLELRAGIAPARRLARRRGGDRRCAAACRTTGGTSRAIAWRPATRCGSSSAAAATRRKQIGSACGATCGSISTAAGSRRGTW